MGPGDKQPLLFELLHTSAKDHLGEQALRPSLDVQETKPNQGVFVGRVLLNSSQLLYLKHTYPFSTGQLKLHRLWDSL